MGRGWQDRRDSDPHSSPLGVPPPSPLPSPPSAAADGVDNFSDVAHLPRSIVDRGNDQDQVGTEFLPKSRFPVMRTVLPLGALTRAHGFGKA